MLDFFYSCGCFNREGRPVLDKGSDFARRYLYRSLDVFLWRARGQPPVIEAVANEALGRVARTAR